MDEEGGTGVCGSERGVGVVESMQRGQHMTTDGETRAASTLQAAARARAASLADQLHIPKYAVIPQIANQHVMPTPPGGVRVGVSTFPYEEVMASYRTQAFTVCSAMLLANSTLSCTRASRAA